jgi:hypothetical protein
VVGDPETVADEHGRLPRDRREAFRCEFAAKVNAEVSGLNEELPALRASLRATRDRRERAAAREELRRGTARLAYLQALPMFTVLAATRKYGCAVSYLLVRGHRFSSPAATYGPGCWPCSLPASGVS